MIIIASWVSISQYLVSFNILLTKSIQWHRITSMIYQWNKDKNLWLKKTRKISFEQIVVHIEQGGLLDVIQHPNSKKYHHQKILVICIKNYIYIVPFVESDEQRFLKTIIPSRVFTQQYLGGNNER